MFCGVVLLFVGDISAGEHTPSALFVYWTRNVREYSGCLSAKRSSWGQVSTPMLFDVDQKCFRALWALGDAGALCALMTLGGGGSWFGTASDDVKPGTLGVVAGQNGSLAQVTCQCAEMRCRTGDGT